MKRKKKIDLKSFYNSYISSLRNSLYKVDLKKISTIIDLLMEQFKKKKNFYLWKRWVSRNSQSLYL